MNCEIFIAAIIHAGQIEVERIQIPTNLRMHRQIGFIHTMEYRSAIKGNEVPIHATPRVNSDKNPSH